MAGLVNTFLRKTLGRICFDQLMTLLAEAEAAVTSSPLTSVTADYEGMVDVLTPSHFLVGGCPTAIRQSTSQDEDELDFLPESLNNPNSLPRRMVMTGQAESDLLENVESRQPAALQEQIASSNNYQRQPSRPVQGVVA